MKKLLLISAINFSSMFATNIAFIDFEKVASDAQAMAAIRRAATEGQMKLQSAQQKLNEYRLEAEKNLMKEYESFQKSGSLVSVDSLKAQEIDASTKLQVGNLELKAEQEKLQSKISKEIKIQEDKIRSWAKPFSMSKSYSALVDKKAAFFLDDSLDKTVEFVEYCDKMHAAEIKKNDLLAKSNSTVVDLSKTQKNTVLAQADNSSSAVSA